MIEELGRLLDALDVPRLHLLGQSWGTIVAAEYALSGQTGWPVWCWRTRA
jgi:pimeloyl-ACP methyl ester carboxylesterase